MIMALILIGMTGVLFGSVTLLTLVGVHPEVATLGGFAAATIFAGAMSEFM